MREPLRNRIIASLQDDGPCTTNQLRKRLGLANAGGALSANLLRLLAENLVQRDAAKVPAIWSQGAAAAEYVREAAAPRGNARRILQRQYDKHRESGLTAKQTAEVMQLAPAVAQSLCGSWGANTLAVAQIDASVPKPAAHEKHVRRVLRAKPIGFAVTRADVERINQGKIA